jgi:hypothetical protein
MMKWLANLLIPQPETWSPHEPLLRIAPGVTLTIGQSFEGAFAFGASGSGKTSACIYWSIGT